MSGYEIYPGNQPQFLQNSHGSINGFSHHQKQQSYCDSNNPKSFSLHSDFSKSAGSADCGVIGGTNSLSANQSPEPQQLKPQYVSEQCLKTMMFFQNKSVESLQKPHTTPTNLHNSHSQGVQLTKPPHVPLSQDPTESLNIHNQHDEILLLKKHLKQKYPNYSDEEIDDIIFKFINDYLTKIKNFDGTIPTQEEFDQLGDLSRSSLSTNLDWNDRNQLEKYCTKMKKIESEQGFRPSEYFGAIEVSELHDGIGDPKIDQLFSECFGIKSHNQKLMKSQNIYEQPLKHNQNQPQVPQIAPQISGNNTIQNYWTFYIVNDQEQANMKSFKEDDCAHVLSDKLNKMPLKVLDQSQPNKKTVAPQKVKSSNQDTLKKYMSPQELNRLKNQKNSSKSIAGQEQESVNPIYASIDMKHNHMLQSYQSLTQLNSPQSFQTVKHQQQISSLSQASFHTQSQSSLPTKQNSYLQKASYQQSQVAASNKSTANPLSLSMKSKHHQSTHSLSGKYKNILYKQQQQPPHHQQNMLSISSFNSNDSKIKPTNSMSYLNDNQSQVQKSIENFTPIQEGKTLYVPKPPQGVQKQLSIKCGRDSNETQNVQVLNSPNVFSAGVSPRVSPDKPTLLQKHQISKPQVGSTQNLAKSSAQIQMLQTMNPSVNHKCLLSKSIEKSDVNIYNTSTMQAHQKGTQSFAEIKSQLNSNIHNSQRAHQISKAAPESIKAQGRNNSLNFFKTSNNLNNVQSFLIQSPEASKHEEQDMGSVQCFDTESSPIGSHLVTKQKIEMVKAKSSTNCAQASNRPQSSTQRNGSAISSVSHHISNAHQLHGKPPTNKASFANQTGMLSQTASTKNLKIQQKNLALTQTFTNAQNSSRKQQFQKQEENLGLSVINEVISVPLKLSRPNDPSQNSQRQYQTVSQYTSLSKERIMKTNESIERKKSQNNFTVAQKPSFSKVEKKIYSSMTASSSLKNLQPKITKPNEEARGKSRTNGQQIGEMKQQQNFNQTIQRINKSLDKIKQIFMNGKPQPTPMPQSTKNKNEQKLHDLFTQINNYKSLGKKTFSETFNNQPSAIQNAKSKPQSKNRKDEKKQPPSQDTFKKYLSHKENGLIGGNFTAASHNSFK